MCIICASPIGAKQPTEDTIRTMFARNPHGAGFMYTRNGKVHISKGYMDIEDFLFAVASMDFTERDAVVYHFRISTQAGVNPAMTHPFPLSNRRAHMKALDVICQCGVAHNGIIKLTSDPNQTEYSDTAIFITDYLAKMVRNPRDLHSREVMREVWNLAQSKFAIMDATGFIATVGHFIIEDGIRYSNYSYTTDLARNPWAV